LAFVAGIGAGGYVVHAWYAPRLEVAEIKVQALGEDLRRQNRAVDDLKKAGDERAAKANAALKAAEAARKKAEADWQNLLLLQPPPGVDRCTAASNLIRKELAQ
jgi:hypothetical protein